MDIQTIAVLGINTLGIVEWIKGFSSRVSGRTPGGNVLRVLQLAVAFALALSSSYLPDFVTKGFTILAVTTLYKTDITEAGKTIISSLGKGRAE